MDSQAFDRVLAELREAARVCWAAGYEVAQAQLLGVPPPDVRPVLLSGLKAQRGALDELAKLLPERAAAIASSREALRRASLEIAARPPRSAP